MSGAGLLIKLDRDSCRGYVDSTPYVEELSDKWFGKLQQKRLVLDLVEVAYLLSHAQGKVTVVDPSGRTMRTVEELVEAHGQCFESSFWPMLSVLKDLRDRGRKVRVLEPMKFLIKTKNGDLRLVYILEEKSIININALISVVEEARRNNLKATLAIVSLQGELTYYDLNEADIRVE